MTVLVNETAATELAGGGGGGGPVGCAGGIVAGAADSDSVGCSVSAGAWGWIVMVVVVVNSSVVVLVDVSAGEATSEGFCGWAVTATLADVVLAGLEGEEEGGAAAGLDGGEDEAAAAGLDSGDGDIAAAGLEEVAAGATALAAFVLLLEDGELEAGGLEAPLEEPDIRGGPGIV